ncbi:MULTISPECIES: signal peptidase II [Pseudomonadaceae]|uniref:Lipoprotein signal peptidase n=1 Tax=Stutzerimonas decontaminans TaxID=3022791 RepID=A0ABX4VUW2_9GAMM|nr:MULTISPECIES: signal peptidase II [Pseudomonadaceae]EIK51215.1 prolipoprotein signal peptidase [Stutzerimonas stutzeri TS44]PKM00719.1 MAG: lipoprotein signal peptidase [Gammaproteobacteria bacterium HGW-Gammaproteobacteria-9]MBA1238784.1 lipoprotein signal peptidase [Stutzerimonas kunmingensis]MBA1264583.1 lipoprotein signal peptidase [Stutzerimonas stutzeri]MCQ4246612.1 signal peptidase II [Stutzerimonas decontaminans]
MSSSPRRLLFVAPWFWWMLSLTIASADQALKSAITGSLPVGTVTPLTPFFNLVHFWNTGAAFSFLADAGGWQRYFFIVIALVVSMVLALVLRKTRANSEALGYSLILGGAVGNLIDRAFRGHVIDYLDFYWQSWHWPAFNLADTSIVGGAAMLILSSLLSPNAEAGRVKE